MSLIAIRKNTTGLTKVVMWIAALAMVGTIAFTGLGQYIHGRTAADASPSADEVIATVNGDNITRREYDQALGSFKQQMSQMGAYGAMVNDPMYSAEVHVQALNNVIQQKLTLQIAKEKGLKATDADVAKEREKALTGIRTELGLKANASESDINAALAPYNQSLDQILTDDNIRNSVLAQEYDASVTRRSTPGSTDIDKYYQGLHTQHILISNKSRPDAQAREQAQKIIDELNKSKGANFEALAKKYSDDLGTKMKGGDDGWVNGQTGYVDEFMNAARVLKPGTWTQSPILAPQFGYFVIKLLAVRDDRPKDYAKKKDEYVAQITQGAVQKIKGGDMQAAQAKMKVDVKDPQLHADYILSKAAAPGASPGSPDLNAALAEYNKALKGASGIALAEIQAQRASIFQKQNKTDDQLQALIAAENATGGANPGIALQIGDIYKGKKDSSNALKYYKVASANSFDNVGTHMQLQSDYKALDQPELVAQEKKWIADYQARNKPAGGLTDFGGSGRTITIPPRQ